MLTKFLTWLLTLMIVAFTVLCFGTAAVGCGQLKEEGQQLGKSVIDCTKDSAVKAIEEYSPAVEQVLIDSISGDGKLDKARAKEVTKTLVTDTARCVLAATLARLMRPPSSDPEAPQSSPLAVDLAGLQELRKERLGDLAYKLPDGASL